MNQEVMVHLNYNFADGKVEAQRSVTSGTRSPSDQLLLGPQLGLRKSWCPPGVVGRGTPSNREET